MRGRKAGQIMSVVGIVCEYNPFHEGHKYHIQKAREYTGADVVAAVMNGNFVQRGEPAVADKYTRARMAMQGGADLVFELPVRYGVSSAEDFAYGGILALHSLSFVDHYCFGCEGGDAEAFRQAGDFFAEEPEEYRSVLTTLLREGMSYPAAREQAFCRYFPDWQRERTASEEAPADGAAVSKESGYPAAGLCREPNNILGIEYAKAAKRLQSSMEPTPVRRVGMGYHDTGAPAGEVFLSATAIRENIKRGDFTGISGEAKEILAQMPYFPNVEDFWGMCSYAIREKWDRLETVKDISGDLAARFRESWYDAVSFADFVGRCKTKNITMARIKRCMFQLLLGVEKPEGRETKLPYLRLLGMKREAAGYLKACTGTVILARLSKDRERLGEAAKEYLEQDIRAADLYRSVVMARSGVCLPDEYRRPVILV